MVGFCLDTCHAHAGGNDLAVVERVRAITGRIDLVHANDSRDAFDSGATGAAPARGVRRGCEHRTDHQHAQPHHHGVAQVTAPRNHSAAPRAAGVR